MALFYLSIVKVYSRLVYSQIIYSLPGLSHPTLVSASTNTVFIRTQLGVQPAVGGHRHVCAGLLSENGSSDVGD